MNLVGFAEILKRESLRCCCQLLPKFSERGRIPIPRTVQKDANCFDLCRVLTYKFREHGKIIVGLVLFTICSANEPCRCDGVYGVMGDQEDALEEVYEPFLIQIGFLDRTPRGRVATPLAYRYFGLDAPGRDSRLW